MIFLKGLLIAMIFGITCQNIFQSLSLVAGILLGTIVWWLAISFAASRFSEKFTAKGHFVLKKVCGILLIGFGILCVIRSFLQGAYDEKNRFSSIRNVFFFYCLCSD